MKTKMIVFLLVVVCMAGMFAGCGKKCANGCGAKADSSCMAEMCDNCCDYWMGLNGCYRSH